MSYLNGFGSGNMTNRVDLVANSISLITDGGLIDITGPLIARGKGPTGPTGSIGPIGIGARGYDGDTGQ